MQKQLSIFISSRLSELDGEREIAKAVAKDLGFEATLWEDFPPGILPPREVYEEAIDKCFAFVLIAWADHSPYVERELQRAINTQKPVLAFVKDILSYDEKQRHDDLRKLIYGPLSKTSWSTFRTLDELRNKLRRGLIQLLHSRILSPLAFYSRRDLHDLGTDLAQRAKKQIALLSRTPTLILGPRPYGKEPKYDYERNHYDTLMECVRRAEAGEINFTAGYITTLTKQTIVKEKIAPLAKTNLIELFKHCSKKNKSSNFHLGSCPGLDQELAHFTFMVADDRIGIWFKDPENIDENVCVTVRDRNAADALLRLAATIIEQKPIADLLSELDIQ